MKVGDNTYHSNKADVIVTSPTVTKTGTVEGEYITEGVYNPTNRTITWYIEVDNKERILNDLVITDELNDALTFSSARWQKWDASKWSDVTGINWTTVPSSNAYNISEKIRETNTGDEGSIDYVGRLVIIAIVPDDDDDPVVSVKNYSNTASVTWQANGVNGGGSDDASVGVGYNALTKSGKQVVEGEVDDVTKHQITWTIDVDLKGQDASNFVVYDLFVHDKETPDNDLTGAANWPTGHKIGDDGITRNNGQKYVSYEVPTDQNNTNLIVTIKELYKDNKVIATLVKITGLRNNGSNKVVLKSQVVYPDIIAGNDPDQKVYNTAALYNGTTYRAKAEAEVNYNNNILAKELLNRVEVDNDHDSTKTINPNNSTINAAEGFNYEHKEVIFRLNVNAAKVDFNSVETAPSNAFGEVVVTDTLPKGWEFEKFSNGDYYLIYETSGELNTGESYPTTGSLTAGILLASNSTNYPSFRLFDTYDEHKAISFTFTELKNPYVILVKAKLTDDTYTDYLKEKDNSTVVPNTLKLSSGNWELKDSVEQNVSVNSKLLDKKSVSDATEIKSGIIRWKVDYTPFGLEVGDGAPAVPAISTAIVDTLPQGIDLRTDSKGELIWEQDGNPNIEVYKLKLKNNGEHDEDGKLTPEELKKAITYDNDSRKLTFTFPDGTQAYRLIYVTDITDILSSKEIRNSVSLLGANGKGTNTQGVFEVQDLDAGAMMSRSGFLVVKKTDSGSEFLSGAEFTLYNTNENGEKYSARAVRITGIDGLAKFYGLAPGNYILVETKSPTGYVEHPFEYAVTVADDTYKTTVNGLPQIITNNSPFEVVNYATDELVGHLTISKTVIDNQDGGSGLNSFEFTIEFEVGGETGSSYTYIGHGGASGGTINSGGIITLGHNQSITILGLPVGTRYTITETNYQSKGYTTTIGGSDDSINTNEVEGVIEVKHYTYLVAFTNKQTIGDLTIRKTVAGNAGDYSKKFTFQLELIDAADTEYPYTIYNRDSGVETSGHISSSGEFELAHGEYVTIKDLPAGATYTVTESDYSADGYYTVRTGDVGVIEADKTKSAVFTNIRNVFYPGNLTITKTVTGPGADTKKAFDFVVTFNGATGSYNYTGVGVAAGTIKSGDTISLAHGQSITITGLPEGSTYQVKEVEASAEGYTVTAVGAEGRILPNADAVAAFTNEHTISKIDVTGKKIWVGGPAKKPTIQLQLYRNGVKFGAAVSLKNGTGSYTWTDLDQTDANGKAYKYTVDEVAVPENYKKSVSANGLSVTNTYVDPDSKEDTGSQIPVEPDDGSKDDLPHTGEGRSTSVLGLALIVAGLVLGLFAWQKQRPRKRYNGR